jgi:predicted permease
MSWRHFFKERPKAAEIDEEIRAHLEMAVRERIERGESPRQARRAALLELGNAGVVKEDMRSVWTWAPLETFGNDLRYALRRMRRSPGFTALAVLTLAFGLSVNATVFSLVSSMFLRPLPVKDAERLVLVLRRPPGSELLGGMSWSDYQDYRSGVPELSEMLALAYRPAHLSVDGHAPDRTWIEAVSGNYFSMLGVTPGIGRLFLPGEGRQPNADPVAVLGHDYWRTRLGGDPNVIGRTAVVNGRPLAIVGVAPPGFSSAQWAMAPSAFVLATMMPTLFPGGESILQRRDSGAFKVMARLAPGVTEAQATGAVRAFARRLAEEHRPDDANTRVFVRPERLTRPEPSFSTFVPFAVGVFAVMAGLVLFTACANVANLMFARAIARRSEIGIRGALGAGRRRLIGQLLTESIVMALLAGAVGMLLSYGSGIVLARLSAVAGDVPIRPDERWDWLPVAGATLVSLAAGVATGLFPALRATRVDPLTVVRGGLFTEGPERHFFRSGLVASQVAFSVAVLVCGGLFVRSLLELSTHDLGFRTDRLLLASVDLGLQGYGEERGRRLLDRLLERVRALPGVESAALGSSVPLDAFMTTRAVASPESSGTNDPGKEANAWRTGLNRVDPAYFETLGVTLLLGRGLEGRDDGSSPRVAVVNETFADRLWPGEDAVGKRFRWQSGGDPIEVAGVVRNGKYLMLGEAPRPFVYLPIAQEYGAPATLHVRSRTEDPLALAPALREVIRGLDPDLPVFNVGTMDEHLRSSAFAYLPMRVAAVAASAQGLIALALAVMGVYGVAAFSVTRRTRDIGIHVALGASKADVFRLASGSAFRPTVLGLALGLAASFGLARLLVGLLYGLDPIDVPVFSAVAALMLGVSLLACWLPARRALHLDPAEALRQD